MKPLIIAGAILLLGASPDRTTALMDSIEAQLSLPAGAQPLVQYQRRYAYLGDGSVIGVYVVATNAGEPARSWVKTGQLPRISGGGCAVVTVFFDPRERHVTGARCNFAE